MNAVATWLSALLCLAGCAGSATTTSDSASGFEVAFRATADDGAALAGVTIEAGKKPLGATNSSGLLTTRLPGAEGQLVVVKGTCPEAYVSPDLLPPLRMTRTRALGSAKPEPEPIAYDVVCQKRLRQVVVVVKAERGKNLPVSIDGKPFTRTDADGHAHALIEIDRTVTSLRVDLDTTAEHSLLPQNPGRTFELHGRDAILVFEQPFGMASRPKRRRGPQPPRKHIPQRLD